MLRPSPESLLSNYVVAVAEMRALATAVALDEDIEVLVGARGSGWFINPETGRINADEADLLEQTREDVLGLICHEAAHAAVTRYTHLIPDGTLRRPGIASLMNSLEDCRIEDWLQHRFPGSHAWIERYNNRLFPREAPDLGGLPWFQQYCLGAIHEWWYGEPAPTLADRPRAALEETLDARRRIIEALPPITAEIDLLDALRYTSSPARMVYLRRDRFSPPDAFERLVRLSAYEAYRISWTEIRPIYEALIRDDTAHRDRMKSLEEAFLRERVRGLRHGPPIKGARRRRIRIPPGMALPPGMEWAPPSDDAVELSDLDPEERAALDAVLNASAQDAYEEARREIAPHAERLFDELERILRPASYPRWRTGYPSGSRVDLRAAMTVEVEPGSYARMWERKTLPTKRDPAFMLLIDLSGSMRGDRITAAFRGTVLLCEVLERLQVPFAVHGFQDQLVPFKRVEEPLDDAMRKRLGTMPLEVSGNRPGGRNQPGHNYDGPVLRRAADEFEAWPGGDRILIVVSDGIPSGPGDGDGELKRAVRYVQDGPLHLVGVGLGEGTEHVSRFYPDAIADVPLEHFPTRLGTLLDGLLVGAGPRAHRR